MTRAVIVALLVGAACGSGSATPPAKDPGAISFQTLCAPCHGADAKGYKADHAPSLVNATFLESANDEFLRRGIVYGRPGTAMAAYGRAAGGPLDDASVAQLVGWLRAQGPKPHPLPAAMTGDAARGEPIYAERCKTCHGDRATRGEGIYLANPRFLEAATDSFLRWAVVHGRPGTKMEAFGGKLADSEIDDVIAYVRSLGRPPPLQMLPEPTGQEPLVIAPDGEDPQLKLRADPCAGAGCTPDPRYVAADQIERALRERRRIVIIDARPVSDWRRVHITGAVSIPYHDMKRLSDIPRDVWVVAYCACPHHLSGIVVDELRKAGHARAAVLDEGILEWHRRGYPVIAAPGVEPPPKEPPNGLMTAPGVIR